CQRGVCVGADRVVCTASDQCHVAGTCNPATGACDDPPAPDGTACNDGDACTQTDSCQRGACVGTDPIVCTASDQWHAVGTCDAATGVCSNPPAANGTPCNDGNACTTGETCQGGVCGGGVPVSCDPGQHCVGGSCVCD